MLADQRGPLAGLAAQDRALALAERIASAEAHFTPTLIARDTRYFRRLEVERLAFGVGLLAGLANMARLLRDELPSSRQPERDGTIPYRKAHHHPSLPKLEGLIRRLQSCELMCRERIDGGAVSTAPARLLFPACRFPAARSEQT